MIDPYQQLGLRPTASLDEIKRAYRTLARCYHPDLNPTPEATRQFLRTTEAYHDILRDRAAELVTFNRHRQAAEAIYREHVARKPAPTYTAPSPTASPAPLALQWVMEGLVWTVSLFLVFIPFFVCYQLLQKGLSGWPSLSFFPLVVGGVYGMYQSARLHRKLLC